jgi:hypothetical protein
MLTKNVANRNGNTAVMSIAILHGILCALMLWVVKRANSKKEKLRSELPADELTRLRAEPLDIVGDHHIDFVYGC